MFVGLAELELVELFELVGMIGQVELELVGMFGLAELFVVVGMFELVEEFEVVEVESIPVVQRLDCCMNMAN